MKAQFDCPPSDTPRANGIIERNNRNMEEMSPSLLIAAGLPPFFWEYAVAYAALMSNLREM